MRLSIFVGLLYVAWCINPINYDNQMKETDYIAILLVLSLAFIGDLKDLFKNKKNESS